MPERISRRRFLSSGGALVAGASLASCAGVTIHRKVWQDGRVDVRLADHPELGEPGGRILVGVDGLEGSVFLLNTGSGYTALFAVCTHLQCSLRPSGDFLACLCHGSTFDLTGRVQRGPAERPLPRFKTEQRDGHVTILIEE